MNSFLILFLITLDTLNLDLHTAYKIALRNNPDYRIEMEKTSLQNVSFYKAFFSYLPTFSVSGSYSSTETRFAPTPGLPGYISSGEGYYLTMNLAQKIFSPVSIQRILDGFYSKKSQKFMQVDKKLSLFINVLSNYVDFLKAEKFLEVKEKALESARENARIFREKYRLNAVSKLNHLNSEVNLKQREIEYKEALKNLNDTKWKLLLVLGIKEEKELTLQELNINVEDIDYEFSELMKIGESKKNTILSLKEEKRSAFFDFLFTSFSFLPEIEWGYYITYQDTLFPKSYNYLWDNSQRSKGFYISLGFKFFDYPFDIMQSKKNYNIQKLYVKKSLFDLYSQIENILSSLKLEKERFSLSLSSLEMAEEAYKLAKAQYELGKISYVEFLNAEENMLNARLSYISSQFDYLKYKYNLLFLTGFLEEEIR